MSTPGVLRRNISWNYVSGAVDLVLLLVLTPWLLEHLGTELFGVWVLLHAIMFYLEFFDLGLYGALVKYVAEYGESEDFGAINRLVASTFAMLVVAGTAALAVSGLIAWLFVPAFFDGSPGLVGRLQLATVLLGVQLLIAFPGSIFDAVFEGNQRFDVLSITSIAFSLLSAVLTITVLKMGYGIVALVIVGIGGSALGFVVDGWLLHRLLPRVKVGFGALRGDAFRRVRAYSSWTALNEVVDEGSTQLQKLAIPVFLSVALVTPYAIVTTLAAAIFLLVDPITEVFFPLSSAYDAGQDKVRQRELLLRGTKVVMGVSLPATMAVITCGHDFIEWWLGAGAVTIPAGVLPFVVLSFQVSAFVMTATIIMLAMSRLRPMFWMSVTELAIALALSVVAMPRFGLVGLAGSLLVANTSISLCVLLPYVFRVLEQGGWAFLRESLIKPLLPVAPALGALAVLAPHLGSSLLAIVIKSVVLGGVYVTGFGLLSLSGWERKMLRSQVRELVA